MKKLHHDKNGKFASPNPTPLAKKVIGVRLPMDMDAVVREVAGADLSNWIREAIAIRLQSEGLAHKLENTNSQKAS